MARLLFLGVLCGASALGSAFGAPAKEPERIQVRLNGQTFTLPAGFEIELAAGPPLIERPIAADFDEEGRLYVAESSGSSAKVQIQLQEKPHRLVRLHDRAGDGRFDKRTVFADRLMFPEGVLWHAGSVYVAAPPSIWKLTDTQGAGVADQRVEWFQGKTLTGCANDLHGPYRGPDGWIYWCKGAFARQTYERAGKTPWVTRAAHIFRCRPDGTLIEPVMTGGMDNPVHVVFTPGGERIFSTTFLQHPGQGKRDGLIHAVYGGIYGKDHDPIHEHPWTGPSLMPVLTHLGPAAPCGLTRYRSSVFGPEYRDNLFACLFNMHKVTRHVLTKEGATFRTRDEDFLLSDSFDFHPTGVLEDADGSLLVIDTGGWYKLCCPTSQLVKPDALGGIYRIRRKGAPRQADPRGRTLAWAKIGVNELVRLLDDPRPLVRQRAGNALAGKGAGAIPRLERLFQEPCSGEARRNAVWTASRISWPKARRLARRALQDADESVRQAALHSVSLWRDKEAVSGLVQMLQVRSAHNQRAAAEALGRIGDKAAVPALLDALARPLDRVLEHSLTYALIEIADREGTRAGLKNKHVNTRRAALVALDQMEHGGLDPQWVVKELEASAAALRETAAWIAGRHPEWGETLAVYYRVRLKKPPANHAEAKRLVGQLGRLARSGAFQELLAEPLRNSQAPREVRFLALRAMAAARLPKTPEPWLRALVQCLAADDVELVRETVHTVRQLSIPRQAARALAPPLHRLAQDRSLPLAVRLGALAAISGGPEKLSPEEFALLRKHLDCEQPVELRTTAAETLARARLTTDQLLALAIALEKAGPLELNRILEAFSRTKEPRVGHALLAALKRAPAKAAVPLDLLRRILGPLGPEVNRQAEELYALLAPDAAGQKKRLEELLARLGRGDPARGRAVFNNPKFACISCHAVGYLGGKVGPDLTRIGQIRTERDLLESILFPSASFAQGYEPMLVTTRKGKMYNGLIRENTPDQVVLLLGPDQEVRLARRDIEEIQPSRISLMPAGLDQQLTPQELTDLVAFLKACR